MVTGRFHSNTDGLSRVRSSPCRPCTHPDCPPAVEVSECADQPFDSESTGSSEDADLVPMHSGEDWITLLDDELSQPSAVMGDSFRISRRRIRSASHCHHGFHRELFRPGRRSRACVRSYVITLRWTTVGSCGRGGAHRVLCYSWWYLNPARRNFSCRTMLRCLEVIWAVIEHWPDWPIASISPGCLMM